MLLALQKAIDTRNRLRNPPNAVVDRPIELRNGRPVKRLLPVVVPAPQPVVEFVPRGKIDDFEMHQRCLEFFNASIAATDDRPFVSRITVKQIIRTVAKFYDMPVHSLLSRRRTTLIARRRQVVMWLTSKLATFSLPYIGLRLNGLDHTTVLHGIRRIEALRRIHPELQAELDQLMSALRPTQNESDDDAEDTGSPSP